MVIEIANVVAFQPFSSSKLQYSERWSCETLREKEELHVKLKSVTNAQEIPWTVLNQSKCSILINTFLISLRKKWDWSRHFSSVQPRLVIEQQSTVARGRSLTSKFMKAIVPVLEKDTKLFMEELKEYRSYAFFSKQSIIVYYALVGSQLRYGDVVWGIFSRTKLTALQRLQKQALK